MKACLYCRSEIDKMAFVCKFCTRPCLTNATSISHVGPIAVIGVASDGTYGLWSVAHGGDPWTVWERNDKNWQRAYKRFTSVNTPREGGGVGVGVLFPLGE